jgi:hypothetical protein
LTAVRTLLVTTATSFAEIGGLESVSLPFLRGERTQTDGLSTTNGNGNYTCDPPRNLLASRSTAFFRSTCAATNHHHRAFISSHIDILSDISKRKHHCGNGNAIMQRIQIEIHHTVATSIREDTREANVEPLTRQCRSKQ